MQLVASKSHERLCEQFSINISPASILNGDFRRMILEELKDNSELGRMPNRVILEITETFGARDIEVISNFAKSRPWTSMLRLTTTVLARRR